VDTRLIIEGGQRIQPSKWVQGLDYPETITRLVKKPGGKEGKSSDFPPWLGLRWLWPAEILGQAKAASHSLALAWPGPSHSFWCTKSNNAQLT